jgi:hypothetical protein
MPLAIIQSLELVRGILKVVGDNHVRPSRLLASSDLEVDGLADLVEWLTGPLQGGSARVSRMSLTVIASLTSALVPY